MSETIYEDVIGRISGTQNKNCGSVTLFADHKDGVHEQVSIPLTALEGVVFFLNRARGL